MDKNSIKVTSSHYDIEAHKTEDEVEIQCYKDVKSALKIGSECIFREIFEEQISQKSFLIVDYFDEISRTYRLGNKYRRLNRKSNALKKTPLCKIPLQYEYQWELCKRESIKQIWFPYPKEPMRRRHSFDEQLTPTLKAQKNLLISEEEIFNCKVNRNRSKSLDFQPQHGQFEKMSYLYQILYAQRKNHKEFQFFEIFTRNGAHMKQNSVSTAMNSDGLDYIEQDGGGGGGYHKRKQSSPQIGSPSSSSSRKGSHDLESFQQNLNNSPNLSIYLNKKGFFDLIFLQRSDTLKDYKDNQLFEKLILTYCSRDKLLRMLLLGYKLYVTPMQLFSEIMKRFFFLQYEKNNLYNEKFSNSFIEFNQCTIIRFIKLWLTERKNDFEGDPDFHDLVYAFLDFALYNCKFIKEPESTTTKIIFSILNGSDDSLIKRRRRTTIAQEVSSPLPKFKINSQSERTIAYHRALISQQISDVTLQNIQEIFLQAELDDFCRQLCMFDENIIKSIRLIEFLQVPSPDNPINYVQQVNLHSNYFCLFLIFLFCVIDEIDPFLERIIQICKKLLELRNYQSFGIILRAMNHPVSQAIFQDAEKKNIMNLEPLQNIFDEKNKYQNLKKAIEGESYPMIPFIPVIKFEIETGAIFDYDEKEDVKYESLIHFKRLDMMTDAFEKLHKSQQVSYKFDVISSYQKFFGKFYKTVLFKYFETTDIIEIEDRLKKLFNHWS